jgi:hypothetical protein
MKELKIEYEPKGSTPLEIVNMLNEYLEEMTKPDGDEPASIEAYAIAIPSFKGDFLPNFDVIHSKDTVKP